VAVAAAAAEARTATIFGVFRADDEGVRVHGGVVTTTGGILDGGKVGSNAGPPNDRLTGPPADGLAA
jgi:hypothetical protein